MTWQLNNNHHNNKLWKILKEMGIPDHLTCLLKNLYAGQEAKLELNIERWIASKLGKEYDRAVYCHLANLTYMLSTSCKMPGWMNHNLESRFLGEISTTSDMQMILLQWQKVKRTKKPLGEGERGKWKSWPKTQHSKTKIMSSGLITSWQIDGVQVEKVACFIFWSLKSLQTVAMKLKDICSLEGNLWPT